MARTALRRVSLRTRKTAAERSFDGVRYGCAILSGGSDQGMSQELGMSGQSNNTRALLLYLEVQEKGKYVIEESEHSCHKLTKHQVKGCPTRYSRKRSLYMKVVLYYYDQSFTSLSYPKKNYFFLFALNQKKNFRPSRSNFFPKS